MVHDLDCGTLHFHDLVMEIEVSDIGTLLEMVNLKQFSSKAIEGKVYSRTS